MLHFSTCLPRNDFCTAEPQTIIYSSHHRQAVHEAKIKVLLRDDPTKHITSAPPTTFPPSKRSLAPMTEVQEFVNRFRTYHKSEAEFQPANPQPNRPNSSSSQTNNDDERLTRTSYNVYLHAPRPLIQRGRGDILQHLKLHVRSYSSRLLISSTKRFYRLLTIFFLTKIIFCLLRMPMNSIKSLLNRVLKSSLLFHQIKTLLSSVIERRTSFEEDTWIVQKN